MFNQLYIQTEYSMLQSACRLESLLQRLKDDNTNACAITDEGTMYGTIKFYKACIQHNIKPVIGLKVNYKYNDENSCILLYAMNEFGYKNLMKISSRSKLNGGVVDFEYLEKASMGLLAIVPFIESNVSKHFVRNELKYMFEDLSRLSVLYDILYIGMDLPVAINELCNNSFDQIYNLFIKNNYKMVATPKVSFVLEEDLDAYVTLKSIKQNANIYEKASYEKYNYLHLSYELESIYANYLDLINNTIQITDKCNLNLSFDKYHLPLYEQGLDTKAYLKELSYIGLNKRMSSFEYSYNQKEYIDRLNYELETIDCMGFNDYFLIVYDYVKYSKKHKIYVGPGRGSGGASLVAYSLGITDIDPIKYGLLFERFLNKERISMPDIDIDFQDDRRDEVIRYVGKRYGKDHVAHIATFTTFKAKLALSDTIKVYKLPEQKSSLIYKYLSKILVGKDAYKLSLKDAISKSPELLQLMDDYDDINKVLTIATKLEGIPRNISTHAAGIVMTKHDLVNYTPLDDGLDEIFQTQYEATDLEELGLLKMDFLGLKNLTNIQKTIELIKKDNPTFELPKQENDQATYEMLRNGDVSGVFQLESSGMRKLIMNMKVSCLDDIVEALALYRPGPMDMIPTFLKRKFKEEKVEYPHKDLEPILGQTYGTIVYQEQIMQIAWKFAGYTLGKADVLRRAVSKKKRDVLEKERIEFVNSSMKLGYSEEDANNVYDYIVKFANYGFNKAHSVAYAKVAYLTAYLKRHYFKYYFSTLMSSFADYTNDMIEYTKEASSKGVEVCPPSINKSVEQFSVVDGDIYFPLSVIKGLGVVKTKELLEERAKGKFKSFDEFLLRTKDIFPLSIIENIIYSGALDEFGLTKKAMIESYLSIIEQSTYAFVKGMIKKDYINEEYAYGMLQAKEKEMIGINLKYNFFKQCASLYKKQNLIKISEIVENKDIKTMGIIKSVKTIETKQKEKMAFVEIGDDTSNIEVVFFPKLYKLEAPLEKDMIILIAGRTQKRTTLQIVAEYIKKI